MTAYKQHQREVSNKSEDWSHCLEVCVPASLSANQLALYSYNPGCMLCFMGAWIMNSFSSSLGPVSAVGSSGLATEVDVHEIQRMQLTFTVS